MSSQPGQPRRSKAWERAVAQLDALGCGFRLRQRPGSPYIQIRQLSGSKVLRSFSIQPLRIDSDVDIEEAVRLCVKAQALGHWPQAMAPQQPGRPMGWPELAERVAADVRERIVKHGSRVHVLNDLRLRISHFHGKPTAERLEAWVLEVSPVTQARTFTRRLECLAQIEQAGVLELGETLSRLRRLRPRGAVARLQRSAGMRVRVVPEDEAIEAWLDRLDPFNQWMFAVLATYGLRPHELWHVQPPDAHGWVTIPGGMRTKSARAHFAPPVPRHWLERYGLAQRWGEEQALLLERWPIRWEKRAGVAIPVNNAELGQYLRKQFTLRGLEKLVAPLADGAGEDWLRPYDLRHAYAIRCALSEETERVDPEQQAEWLGHGLELHQRIYLRWLPDDRKRRAQQRLLGQ